MTEVGRTNRARLYRMATRLYPREFRRAYGDEMTAAYEAMSADARVRRGAWGTAVLQLKIACDVLRIAAREHRLSWSSRTGARHRPTAAGGGPAPPAATHPPRLSPPEPRLPARGNSMETLIQDLRYALRTLKTNPGFTAVAVLALALGIGASSAIFGVVDAILLRPLPYPEAHELVMVWERDVSADTTGDDPARNTPAVGNFAQWRERAASFSLMSAYAAGSVNLTGEGEPQRLNGQRVAAGFFEVLAVQPALGRVITPEEDQPGAATVIVISHALWQRQFNADPAAVGTSIMIDSVPFTVIGVMPGDFEFPDRDTQFWIPFGFAAADLQNNRSHYLQVVARLRPSVDLAAARAEMDALAERLHTEIGGDNPDHGVYVSSLREEMVGDTRPVLVAVMGAIGFVLLIACGNVANLLLARTSARGGEIAVRTALGAGRGRIVRQLLTESVVLALAGGVLGLALAYQGVDMFRLLVPGEIPVAARIGIDARVAGFGVLVSLLTAALFGLAPAWHASRPDLGGALKEGAGRGGAGDGAQRFRSLLAGAEVALAVVLLVGAGLTVRSFAALLSEDPGLRVDNVLTLRTELTGAQYDAPGARPRFYEQVRERVGALPGVRDAGFVTFVPMTFSGGSTAVTPEGHEDVAPEDRIYPVFRVVGPGYYETMSIPVRGRTFAAADRQGTEPVAVVNRSFADAFWPGEDAIGKHVTFSGRRYQIVGVAGDVRQFALAAGSRAEFNISYRQWETWSFFMPRDLVIRADGDPAALTASVRTAIAEVDPDMPVSFARTMDDIVAGSVAGNRINMQLFASLGVAALVLASLGVYGVVAYAVSQRSREIGVRMALGADVADVLGMILRQGGVLVAGGLAVGLGIAWFMAGRMERLLYGVEALDTTTFVAVPLLLGLIAMIAIVIPARRAGRIDPVAALRAE